MPRRLDTLPLGNIGPVNPVEMFRHFDFDPHGPTERDLAFTMAPDALTAFRQGVTSWIAAELLKARKGELPIADPNNVTAVEEAVDAFRHALWNYRMAKSLGSDKAKQFGDAYERHTDNPLGDRLMDLHNNKVGRQLAAEERNRSRPDEEVILEALGAGKLRLRPYLIADGL